MFISVHVMLNLQNARYDSLEAPGRRARFGVLSPEAGVLRVANTVLGG